MLTAVVTTHKVSPKDILDNLRGQTVPPTEIILITSEVPNYYKVDQRVHDWNRNDWGHEKRATGLHLANQPWVGFFNADDVYEDTYIEEMTKHTKGHDFIYCDFTSHIYGGDRVKSKIQKGYITSGNFIVRTAKARGHYESRGYTADWEFINSIPINNPKHIDRVLYHHR